MNMAVEEVPVESVEELPNHANRLGKRAARVLMVDDDPANLRFLGKVLKEEGYQLYVAANGQQALDMAERIAPDLILLDVLMPDLDGFQVCERLKHSSATKRIPVIFLTSIDDRDSVVTAFKLGAVDYITKPFDKHELRVRVETHAALALMSKKLRRTVSVRSQQLDAANKQLQRLALELVLSGERERRSLASDLHDSTIHRLALVKAKLGGLQSRVGGEGEEGFEELGGLVDESIKELRTLIFDLSPPVLYDLGLDAALEWLAQQASERWSVPFGYRCAGALDGLPLEKAILLFQSARELVINVVKHAKANKGRIEASGYPEAVTISIVDDGRGFDQAGLVKDSSQQGGFGLFSIRQRMEQLGGSCRVRSGSEGTRIDLELPLDEADHRIAG